MEDANETPSKEESAKEEKREEDVKERPPERNSFVRSLKEYFIFSAQAQKERKAQQEKEILREAVSFSTIAPVTAGQGIELKFTRYDAAIFFGIFIGVLFSSAVFQYVEKQEIILTITAVQAIVAFIIACAIAPKTFHTLAIDPQANFISSFGMAVQNGVFFSVILSALGKAYAG